MERRKLIFLPLCLLCIPFLLSGCGKTSIPMMDNIEVSFSGTNGNGSASVSVDWETIEDTIMDSAEDTWDGLGGIIEVEDAIDVSVSPDEELSNGDKVTVTINYDKDTLSEHNLKLSGPMKQDFTVEGLTDVEIVDAFDPEVFDVKDGEEGILIEFTGASPDAEVQIRSTLPSDHPLSDVQYSADPSNGLSEGDTITITATLPYSDEPRELKEESTTVTVDSVASYVDDLEEIDDETWEEIKAQCDDLWQAKGVNGTRGDTVWLNFGQGKGMGSDYTYSNFAYQDVTLLHIKDGLTPNWWDGDTNYIYIGYYVDLATKEDAWNESEPVWDQAYGVFVIEDLIQSLEGETQFSIDMLSVGDIYQTKESFENTEINTMVDEYDVSTMELDW